MCGICGTVARDPGANAAVVGRMTDMLRHRGPDGSATFVNGQVALGHTRLAIIDLSDAGRQPMQSGDGRYTLVYNGEIYNYLELRRSLESSGAFRSHTDTEVLLRLFEREGLDCVRRLNGMFAFAVWDAKEQVLFAARDRLGIKPLYFAVDSTRFLFASEIKAIIAAPSVAEINPPAVADYLTFQFCLGDKTLFRGVRKLLPGHSLTLKPGATPEIRRYWEPDYTIDPTHDEGRSIEELRALVEDAIRLQLRADVPIGAHLSGGLDSTAVTCVAASLAGQPFHTFSGAFDAGEHFDESRYATLVAARAGTVHHETRPTARDFVAAMPKLAYLMDEPAGGPGVFGQYFVSALAREHVKVVLGGQGADEVFGGYARYLALYLEACLKWAMHGPQEDARYIVTFDSILPNLQQLHGYEPLLQKLWANGLFEDVDQRYFRLIDRAGSARAFIDDSFWEALHDGYSPFDAFREEFTRPGCSALINKMTRFDLNTLLPALLHVEDRTSMAASLESRVPLLDHRIVELAAAMPPKIKFKGGRSKHVFREAVRPSVPPEVFARTDKMGFPVPVSRWYGESPVREFVSDTLRSASASHHFVQRRLIDQAVPGEADFDRGIWGLLNLELWMQAFVDAPTHVLD